MLNDAQMKAVNCTADKILVLAGAGTGKTHTMISRISRLVDEGVSTSSILVLTFTNAAACEMRERYRRNHKNQSTPTFCTFHSYCYSLISKNRDVAKSLGYFKGTPRVADDMAIKKLHTKCRQQCGTKLSEDKIKGRVSLKANEKFQYDIYWKQYNKLLRDENYITFDIMCYGVSKLFADNKPIVESEKKKFNYIFVDEFQDTDPKQWDFVSSFESANLFVVGDAKQSIYGFRGADSSIIKSLAENPEWTTIKLSENYRSTNPICRYANKIHSDWEGNPYDLKITSIKEGITVEERGVLNLYDTKDIMSVIDDSSKGKSVAILCRSNREVDDVKSALKRLNIPFNSNHNGSNVAGILKSAIDSEYFVDWLSNKLRSSDYNEYLKHCAIDESYCTEMGFLELYQNKVEEYVGPIMEIRRILQNEQFAFGKITAISELLDIPQGSIKLESDDDAGVIKYLIELADSLSEETGIYVGTIHSVKGLEYDCVHVMSVNSRSFEVHSGEEMQNLFYVACTRAKEKLVIYMYDKEIESEYEEEEF